MEFTSPQKKVLDLLINGESLFITGFQQTGKSTIIDVYYEYLLKNKPDLISLEAGELKFTRLDPKKKYVIFLDNIVSVKEYLFFDPKSGEPIDARVKKTLNKDAQLFSQTYKNSKNIAQIVIAGHWFHEYQKHFPNLKHVWLRRPIVDDGALDYDFPHTDRLRGSQARQ